MSEKIVTVSVPPPIPATWGRPDLSKSPIAILWLSTLGTSTGAPSVPSAACANSWMPSPDRPTTTSWRPSPFTSPMSTVSGRCP